jgi:hypothetical protein
MTATVRPIAAYLPDWMVFASDPLDGVREALLLLQSGMAGKATRLLERIPDLIEAERLLHAAQLEAARRSNAAEVRTQYNIGYLEGRAAGERAMHRKLAPKPPPSPFGHRRHEWLQGVLADPEGRAKARSAVTLSDALLDRVAAGRAELTGAQWRKLREALTTSQINTTARKS